MKTQRTYDFTACICEHSNVMHHSDGACFTPGCLCAKFIKDMWLTRIVFRRQIAMFAARNAP